MEIGDWLRGLGLSQYEAAFRENSIDLEVLRKLTPEDRRTKCYPPPLPVAVEVDWVAHRHADELA